MTDVYLLQNQHNEFFSKSGDWLAGGDSKALYRSKYKDEAINQKVEFSVKNPKLRISLVKGMQKVNGRVIVEGFGSASTVEQKEAPELESLPNNGLAKYRGVETITELHGTHEALSFDNNSGG